MNIWLDGNVYTLRSETGVRRTAMQEWPDNIRLDGQQRRKDRRYLSSWSIDNWSAGLGIEDMNPDLPDELYSLYDAENVDTRFERQITLSPAFVTCTVNPSRGDLDLSFNWLNNLYFLETKRGGTAAFCYQFAGPETIGSFRTLTSTNYVGTITAIKALGGNIACVYYHTGTVNTILGVTPSLGNAFTTRNSLGNDSVSRYGHISNLGGTIHYLDYVSDKSLARLWVGNGALGSLEQVASIATNIGTNMAPLISDGLTMYAQLPKGIYDFDLTPAVVVSTDRAQDLNCSQVLYQNYLYFKNKKSLIRYDGVDTISVGYDRRDGLVPEKFGEITSMISSGLWNFCAVKGGTYSHILAMGSTHAWQYYARVPSPGLWVRELFLSDSPDAIDRLWVIYGNYGYPGYFMNPMVNPLSAGTYEFVPTGQFTPPRFGGGLDEIQAGFYDIAVTGGSLNANNEITMLYGLNGVGAVTTLGVISSNSQSVTFASPNGVAGYNIQPKFMLTTGSSAQTPIFRKAIVHYLKDPDKRETFDFDIDVEQSARETVKSTEAVIGSLNYVSGLKTLVPFWYGQIATKYVKVLDNPSDEDVENQEIYQGEREAFIKLRLGEIL